MRRCLEPLEARRLFASLVPDVTWAADGVLPGGFDGFRYVGQAGGRIVAVTDFGPENGGNELTVRRYHADGTEDRKFRTIRFGGYSIAAALDSGGRTLVGLPAAFLAPTGSGGAVTVSRYTPSGRPDRSLRATIVVPGRGERDSDAVVRDLHAANDGATYAVIDTAGTAAKDVRRTRTVLARINPDGTQDATFAGNGRLGLGTVRGNTPTPVRLFNAPRGGLYLWAGGIVTRLRADGSRDRGFGDDGRLGAGRGVGVDAAGRLLVLRKTPTGTTLDRFDTRGRLDTTFGTNGTTFIARAGVVDAGTLPSAVLAPADGPIVVQLRDGLTRRVDPLTGRRLSGEDTAERPIIDVQADGGLLADAGATLSRLAADREVVVGNSGTLYVRPQIGDDVYVRPDTGGRLRVGIGGRVARVPAARVNRIDAILGGGNNRFVTPLDLPTSIISGPGRDTIVTAGGDDDITAGAGNDKVTSGAGDDFISAGDGNNTVNLGSGYDRAFAGNGDKRLIVATGEGRLVPAGRITVRGGGNEGTLDLDSNTDATVDVEYRGASADVSTSARTGRNVIRLNTTGDSYVSTAGTSDSVVGGTGDDLITTGDGDDTLVGGLGDDTLRGGAGDDRLYAGVPAAGRVPAARNELDGGAGRDAARRESDDDVLSDIESTSL